MSGDTGFASIAEDRRRYFRVNDSINLSYRVVSSDEVSGHLEQLEQNMAGSFSMVSNLHAISQQMTACLHKIEQRDADVASYLKALDQKLEMLARAFLAKESGIADQPAQPVNLSAGGMAVHSAEPVEEGATLEIRMLLLPSFTGILTYGTLVTCEANPDDAEYPYLLRIDFSHLRDVDRDALIRHLLRRQAEILRKRREEGELEGSSEL